MDAAGGGGLPCGCNKCFFCLTKITTGIDDSPTKMPVELQFKCSKRMRTDECTNDRVNLGKKSGAYYKMC